MMGLRLLCTLTYVFTIGLSECVSAENSVIWPEAERSRWPTLQLSEIEEKTDEARTGLNMEMCTS